MTLDIWERLVRAFRILLPFTSVVVLVCITNAFLPAPWLNAYMPKLVFPAVWFWLLRRPELMHFSLVFILGLISDLLSSSLIGFTPLALLILYRLITHFDRFFKSSPYLVLWITFTIFVFSALAIEWIFNALLFWTMLAPGDFIVKGITTAIVLPLIIAILVPIDKIVLGQR